MAPTKSSYNILEKSELGNVPLGKLIIHVPVGARRNSMVFSDFPYIFACHGKYNIHQIYTKLALYSLVNIFAHTVLSTN